MLKSDNKAIVGLTYGTTFNAMLPRHKIKFQYGCANINTHPVASMHYDTTRCVIEMIPMLLIRAGDPSSRTLGWKRLSNHSLFFMIN